MRAKKVKPESHPWYHARSTSGITQKHKPIVWENMLGTVYSRNAEKQVKYHDYNYEAAHAHARTHEFSDLRVAKSKHDYRMGNNSMPEGPRKGRYALWGVPKEKSTVRESIDDAISSLGTEVAKKIIDDIKNILIASSEEDNPEDVLSAIEQAISGGDEDEGEDEDQSKEPVEDQEDEPEDEDEPESKSKNKQVKINPRVSEEVVGLFSDAVSRALRR